MTNDTKRRFAVAFLTSFFGGVALFFSLLWVELAQLDVKVDTERTEYALSTLREEYRVRNHPTYPDSTLELVVGTDNAASVHLYYWEHLPAWHGQSMVTSFVHFRNQFKPEEESMTIYHTEDLVGPLDAIKPIAVFGADGQAEAMYDMFQLRKNNLDIEIANSEK